MFAAHQPNDCIYSGIIRKFNVKLHPSLNRILIEHPHRLDFKAISAIDQIEYTENPFLSRSCVDFTIRKKIDLPP